MHRKAPVLESLFNKFAGLKTSNIIKKGLQHFQEQFFYRTPPVGAFVYSKHWNPVPQISQKDWFYQDFLI